MDLDTLRGICLSLPGATEEIQWEHHLLFKVGGKMFCITELEYAGKTSFKVSNEDFETLLTTGNYIGSPYMAHNKWVRVVKPKSIPVSEWKERVEASYQIIRSKLTKKAQRELDAL
jgi:predicted DNA-binding protein (MmcQ/YjbR family)